jgi:hypothetical protein
MSEEEKDMEEKEELPLSERLQKRTIKKSMMSVARGCSDLTNSSSDRKKGNFTIFNHEVNGAQKELTMNKKHGAGLVVVALVIATIFANSMKLIRSTESHTLHPSKHLAVTSMLR